MNAQDYQNAAMRTAPEGMSAEDHSDVIHRFSNMDVIGGTMFPHIVGEGATRWLLPGESIGVLHAILGIAGELGELAEAIEKPGLVAQLDDIAKEFGDVWWYAALLNKSMKWDFANFVTDIATEASHLCDHEIDLRAHLLTEPLKKWLFYGKAIKNNELYRAAVTCMASATAAADRWNIDIETAHRLNVEKLRVRFPEKFDASLAQNHNGK